MALKIIINAIGRITERELVTLNAEYIKRTKWSVAVNEFTAATKAKEAKALWPADTGGAYVIAMDEKGKQMDSQEFASLLSKLESMGTSKLYFLIGGADGHEPETLKKANLTLSLGKMTLPHKMARLLLIEQIYRAFTINSGHPYHKSG